MLVQKQQLTKRRSLTYTKNSHPGSMLHFARSGKKHAVAVKLKPEAMESLHNIVAQIGTTSYLEAKIALHTLILDADNEPINGIRYQPGTGLLSYMLEFIKGIEVIKQ